MKIENKTGSADRAVLGPAAGELGRGHNAAAWIGQISRCPECEKAGKASVPFFSVRE
jgi:hypothetical protein